jgi:predicted glycoside hydrolase/deacetylase ChbG (UPF0249 family)
MKKFILCAEEFGYSQDTNRAVLNGYNNGFVKSASLLPNGDAFNTAITEILPECQQLSVGINLNISYGKPLTGVTSITNEQSSFSVNLLKLENIVKQNNVMKDLEKEFRAQIEKCLNATEIVHINSVDNLHAIPEIFELVCKLADEYKIQNIRVPNEETYIVPDFKHIANFKFISNIPKTYKINSWAKRNKTVARSYGLRINDYVIGLTYNGIMDKKALEYGLKIISDTDNIVAEGIIHPRSYLRNLNDNHAKEFKLTQDKLLEDSIARMGYDIVNHKYK